MLSIPYVTTTAFRAHPTYLDLLNLRSGDANFDHQTAELFNILLMASRFADNYMEFGGQNGSLGAHSNTENRRLKLNRDRQLWFHPAHIPILTVASLSYGRDITNQVTVTNPTVWITDGRNVVYDLPGTSTNGWGCRLSPWTPLFTTWTYTAGFANTLLATSASSGATSIQVADATGITAGDSNNLPTSLRIWDPGAEETVTVASTYTAGSTTVPLTAPLVNAHTVNAAAPIGVSALPAEVHLAIVMWATALLMRPNSKALSQWRGTSMKLTTEGEDDAYGDGIGLVAAAKEALEPYRRIR